MFSKTTGGMKGSVRWTAVELFRLRSDQAAFTKEADVWAFGMLTYVSFALFLIANGDPYNASGVVDP